MTAITATTREPGVVFRTELEKWAPDINKIGTRGFNADRVLTAALQATVHEPKIFEATKQSLYLALLKTARWALDIGDTVHLVPLNKKVSKKGESDRYVTVVEAWPDYRGLKALAMRQGVVRGMEEYVVYAGDKFEYQLGLDAYLRHQPVGDPSARGAIVGAYTVIRLPFGERSFNYMPIADIEVIRKKSRSWGPDKIPECPAWYAKKTVVRDYLNRQPKQGALSEALAADDTEEFDPTTGEVFQQLAPPAQAETAPATEPQQDSTNPISEPDRRRLYTLIGDRNIEQLTEKGDHEALHAILRQIRGLAPDADVSTKSITLAEYAEMVRRIEALPMFQGEA